MHEAKYIDFYAFDMNIHLARYGCSQFFHCDKVANTYAEDNIQRMMALQNNENHLSIMISHTGNNKKLVELVRDLHRAKAKTILITSQGKSRMKAYVDEVLLTPRTLTECGSIRMEGLWTVAFSAATKYLLDVMFAMEFSAGYDENIKLSKQYYEIGAKNLCDTENHSNKLKQNFKISFIRADSFETIIQNPSHLLQRTENMLSLDCKEDIAICPLHL